MEKEPKSGGESLEAQFYKSEIEHVNKQLESKKKEALRAEAIISWLEKIMPVVGLDDEMSVHEALSRIALYSERGGKKTYELDAVTKTLDEYHATQRFMKIREVKDDLAERLEALQGEVHKLAEDALRMEDAEDEG